MRTIEQRALFGMHRLSRLVTRMHAHSHVSEEQCVRVCASLHIECMHSHASYPVAGSELYLNACVSLQQVLHICVRADKCNVAFFFIRFILVCPAWLDLVCFDTQPPSYVLILSHTLYTVCCISCICRCAAGVLLSICDSVLQHVLLCIRP